MFEYFDGWLLIITYATGIEQYPRTKNNSNIQTVNFACLIKISGLGMKPPASRLR